jgi:hypothetical protein
VLSFYESIFINTINIVGNRILYHARGFNNGNIVIICDAIEMPMPRKNGDNISIVI